MTASTSSSIASPETVSTGPAKSTSGSKPRTGRPPRRPRARPSAANDPSADVCSRKISVRICRMVASRSSTTSTSRAATPGRRDAGQTLERQPRREHPLDDVVVKVAGDPLPVLQDDAAAAGRPAPRQARARSRPAPRTTHPGPGRSLERRPAPLAGHDQDAVRVDRAVQRQSEDRADVHDLRRWMRRFGVLREAIRTPRPALEREGGDAPGRRVDLSLELGAPGTTGQLDSEHPARRRERRP